LHITKWVANQGASATYPAAVTGAFSNGTCIPAGSSCDRAIDYTASTYPGCSTAFTAANGHSDLYVDYPSDSGFISANNGLLYHIKNIFSTTISPTVDFCIPVNATFETTPKSAMSGSVYDPVLNQVFITDSEKIYAYTVNASGATANFSLAASYTYGNGLSNYNYQTGPGPLLDMFNGFIYVFSTYDANSKTSVTQLPTSLASAVPVALGNKSTNVNPLLFYGAFDNNYFTNGPKSAASPCTVAERTRRLQPHRISSRSVSTPSQGWRTRPPPCPSTRMLTPVGITDSARRSPSFMMGPMIDSSLAWGKQAPPAEPTSSRCGALTANSPTPAAPVALCPHTRL
jgi:hypothetical protein